MDETISKWVDKQISLLECELAFERKRGDADVKSKTSPDKPIIKVLDVVSVTPSKGHYVVDCELSVSNVENFQYFSTGDIVGFVESSKTIVISGILADFTAPHISVSVNIDPSNTLLQEEKKFSIIKLTSDVTFKRMKNALQYLKSPSGIPGDVLISLLFGDVVIEEIPLPPATLKKNGEIDFVNDKLHASQKEAVAYGLKQKHIAIIQGPPGTGKTTTLVEIILQLVKSQQKVLVTAPSNIAVDNVLERLVQAKCRTIRLGHPARMPETFQQFSLDSVIANSDNAKILTEIRSEIREASRKLRKNYEGTRDSITRHIKELRSEIRRRELKTQRDILYKADAILCTLTTSSNDGPLKFLTPNHFDVVVIDECSQGMEAACWIALPRASKVIMAGDHLQLPPTVLSPDSTTSALSISLMERAVLKWSYHMLTHQFRMNETIMKWVSNNVYNGKLTADTSVATHLLKDLPCVKETDETGIPMLLVDTAGMEYEENVDAEGSYSNEEEANTVAALVSRLLAANVPREGIAVITPYSNQVQLLRSLLVENCHVEVKTVDGFQGREKEAVILSLVRSNREGNLGFLTDKRRLNVAVSRARRFLGVVGDSVTVKHDETIKSLLEYVEEYGTVLTPDFYAECENSQQSITQRSLDTKEALERRKRKPTNKQSPLQQSGNQICNTHSSAQSQSNESYHFTKSVPFPQAVAQKQNHLPSEGADSVVNSEPEVEKWKAELEKMFLGHKSVSEHHFKNLTSYERRLVHEAASVLNLEHESFGEGKNRYIAVRHLRHSKTDSGILVEAQQSNKNENDNICRVKCCNEFKSKADDNKTSQPNLSRTSRGDKAQVKKKNQNAVGNVDEDDFDSIVNHFQKLDLRCKYEHCKKSTELISSTCMHCRECYCLEHGLPEVHGCGEAARRHARQTFKHPPPVRTDEHQRNQRLKKLHSKLKEKNDERKAKTKKK